MKKYNKIITIFIVISLILFSLFLFFDRFNYPLGLDIYFHISVAKDILESGSISLSHPIDKTYPNTYSFDYHILFSIISLITGINIETVMMYTPMIFWPLIILVISIIARKFYKKSFLYSIIFASLIPTSVLVGGVLIPRTQIMADFLILISFFILINFLDNKKINLKSNYFFLLILFTHSLVLTHLPSGLLFFAPLTILIFFTKDKFRIKFVTWLIVFFTIILSELMFFLPIFLRWGIPQTERAIEIFDVKLEYLNVSSFMEVFGILIIFFAILGIFITLFKREEKKFNKLFVWFILFVILGIDLFKLNLLPKRYFWEAVYPATIISSIYFSRIKEFFSKNSILLIVLLMVILQIFSFFSFVTNDYKDIMLSPHYNSLEWFKNYTINDTQIKVVSDEWSCVHLSAISRVGCVYTSGFYNQRQKTSEVLSIFFNLDKNLIKENSVGYIYVYEPYTLPWVYSRSGESYAYVYNKLISLRENNSSLNLIYSDPVNEIYIYKIVNN